MLASLQTNGLPTVAPAVNRLSALFNRFVNDDIFSPTPTHEPAFAVPLAMWEDDDKYCIELDMPGLNESDIEVSIQHGHLFVRGERNCERKSCGFDNRSYGRFEQRITLPSTVKFDKVDAKLVNGVLLLTIPKGSEAKPQKIAIRSGQ